MENEKTLPKDFTLPGGFRPVGITARRSELYPPPDWKQWGSMYDVELWQAAALSLNINPDTIKDPARFNHSEHKKRLRLLENWLPKHKRQNPAALLTHPGKFPPDCRSISAGLPLYFRRNSARFSPLNTHD